VDIGGINEFRADQMVADLRGIVTFAGFVFPFDFYDPIWTCTGQVGGGCITHHEFANLPLMFFDAIDSVEITGTRRHPFPQTRSGYPFRLEPPPSPNGEPLGEVGELKPFITIGAINVERLTYISEPNALTALGSGIAMLALLYRRRRHSVE
jgi:hypothetical protein